MKTIEKDLKELFSLQGDEFENKLQELSRKYTNEEDKKWLAEALLTEMRETEKEMDRIGEKLDELALKE